MKKIIGILSLFLSFSFFACSENEELGDFDGDWEGRNATYIDSIAKIARSNQGTAVGQWNVIQSFHLSSTFTSLDNKDYIYAQILKKGTGTDTALYTDSVAVNYRGRLIPTSSYPQGLVFDQNYYGDLVTLQNGNYTFDEENAKIMVPSGFHVNEVVGGWTTALQKMHEGDVWRLYIPQDLGYGSSTSVDNIPAYSALIFDVYLRKVVHL